MEINTIARVAEEVIPSISKNVTMVDVQHVMSNVSLTFEELFGKKKFTPAEKTAFIAQLIYTGFFPSLDIQAYFQNLPLTSSSSSSSNKENSAFLGRVRTFVTEDDQAAIKKQLEDMGRLKQILDRSESLPVEWQFLTIR